MLGRLLMRVLWPSFLAAGLGGGVIFALIDPLDVLVLGRWPVGRMAFYTVSFFVLWLIAAAASALTAWLMPASHEDDPDDL